MRFKDWILSEFMYAGGGEDVGLPGERDNANLEVRSKTQTNTARPNISHFNPDRAFGFGHPSSRKIKPSDKYQRRANVPMRINGPDKA